MSTIASIAYPDRFATLPNDYVITPSISNDQIGFFQCVHSRSSRDWLMYSIASVITRMPPCSYSPIPKGNIRLVKPVSCPTCQSPIVLPGHESQIKSMRLIREPLDTIGFPFGLSRKKFSQPVLVITGDRDAPFCAGNCYANPSEHGRTPVDTVRALFPSVKDRDFEAYLLPDTGHGINFRQSSSIMITKSPEHTNSIDATAALAYARILGFVTAHSKG